MKSWYELSPYERAQANRIAEDIHRDLLEYRVRTALEPRVIVVPELAFTTPDSIPDTMWGVDLAPSGQVLTLDPHGSGRWRLVWPGRDEQPTVRRSEVEGHWPAER